MHYWGALSYAEISQAAGASTEAVKSRLHRPRNCLAKMLLATRSVDRERIRERVYAN
jgi:DNA-directed RNA polymerase specialized sigma24 family protein